MKASGVGYWRAETVEGALKALGESDGMARLLAGGQSLIASLNLRLAEEVGVIDINGLSELEGVSDEGERLRQRGGRLGDEGRSHERVVAGQRADPSRPISASSRGCRTRSRRPSARRGGSPPSATAST